MRSRASTADSRRREADIVSAVGGCGRQLIVSLASHSADCRGLSNPTDFGELVNIFVEALFSNDSCRNVVLRYETINY